MGLGTVNGIGSGCVGLGGHLESVPTVRLACLSEIELEVAAQPDAPWVL